MISREQYLMKLKSLRQDIFKMGVLVEEALRKAVRSLVDQDADLARQVMEGDAEVNRMEVEIEDKSIILIATEQPVASDLRHIITGFKVIAQLERMGDYAVHIAKATIRLASADYMKPLIDIPRMGDACIRMIREILTAFLEDDAEKAKTVASWDEEVDDLHSQVQRELFTYMMQDSSKVGQAIELLFVGRYLERFADQVTNISEWIIYGRTGSHLELNL